MAGRWRCTWWRQTWTAPTGRLAAAAGCAAIVMAGGSTELQLQPTWQPTWQLVPDSRRCGARWVDEEWLGAVTGYHTGPADGGNRAACGGRRQRQTGGHCAARQGRPGSRRRCERRAAAGVDSMLSRFQRRGCPPPGCVQAGPWWPVPKRLQLCCRAQPCVCALRTGGGDALADAPQRCSSGGPRRTKLLLPSQSVHVSGALARGAIGRHQSVRGTASERQLDGRA